MKLLFLVMALPALAFSALPTPTVTVTVTPTSTYSAKVGDKVSINYFENQNSDDIKRTDLAAVYHCYKGTVVSISGEDAVVKIYFYPLNACIFKTFPLKSLEIFK